MTVTSYLAVLLVWWAVAPALSLMLSWSLSVGALYGLKSGKHPIVWAVLTVLSLAWCALAVSSAGAIFAECVATQPSFSTPMSIAMAFPIMVFHVPFWLILLGPSFAVTLAILASAPRPLRTAVLKVLSPLAAAMTGHRRVYYLGGILISLALIFRVCIWLATTH